ncbi:MULTISPECIES: TrbC/VirB2 family protein [Dyella]|nr:MULTISPECIES: TrbC/VirB2 family protein [Dyella]
MKSVERLTTFQLLAWTGIACAATVLPDIALADGLAGADQKVCGFFSNVNNILNLASVTVVTIAIILSGYQIAFAHKRISDVAPILIGGMLIGAAAQVAKMLIGEEGSAEQCAAMVISALRSYA